MTTESQPHDRRSRATPWALLQFALGLLVINVKATFAQRGAFWLQAVIMLINNLIFCVVWFIFFNRFEEINGWRLNEVLLLYAVVAFAFGCSMALTGGTRDLARMIVDGDLDTFLTQPKSALVQVVASRSLAFGWGDIASALFLFWLSGYMSPVNVLLFAVVITCGWAILVSTAIVIHSLAFWLGPISDLARQSSIFLITFSVYPQNIYSGWMKVALFTIVPAGFIGYLPVTLMMDFRWTVLAGLIGATLAYVAISSGVFHWGLRRYESGNRISVRT